MQGKLVSGLCKTDGSSGDKVRCFYAYSQQFASREALPKKN